MATDDWSVVLWISADANGWFEEKDHCLQILFDGPDDDWIAVVIGPGLTREWFGRVETPGRLRKK